MSILDDAGLPRSRAYRVAYVLVSLLIAGLSLVAIWGSTLLIWAAMS